MSPDPAIETLKADWKAYASGTHFPANPDDKPVAAETATTKAPHPLIQALIFLDIAGEAAAKQVLASEVPVEPYLNYWRKVELAGLSDGANWSGSNKWGRRVAELEDVATERPLSSSSGGPNWILEIAEGRRGLMLAEAMNRGNRPLSDGRRVLEEAVLSFEAAGDSYGIARARMIEARALSWRGRLIEAQQALAAAFVRFAALGNKFGIADSAYELGVSLRELHRFEEAAQLLSAATEILALAGRPDALARAEQALALCLVSQIRYGDDRESQANSAYEYAATAFARTTNHASLPWPGGKQVSVNPAQTRRDAFRATMAARDLAELSLLKGQVEQAAAWRNRALVESDKLIDSSAALKGLYVMPSFSADSEPDGERMHALAQNAGPFELVRLAEIDEHLGGLGSEEAHIGLAQIARAWRLRGTPSFEIEAWLAAADRALESKGNQEADKLGTNATPISVAQRLRFEALRRSEQTGSIIFKSYGADILEGISDADRSAADAAGVRVAQVLHQSSERTIYRVLLKESLTSARLVVRRNGARLQEEDMLSRASSLASLSRRRQGIPRISGWGVSEHDFWLLDELMTGQPLRNALENAYSPGAKARMLAGLLLTESALQSLQLGAAGLRLESVIVVPGDLAIAQEYAPFFCSINAENARFVGPKADVSILAQYKLLIEGALAKDKAHNSNVGPLISEISSIFKGAGASSQQEALLDVASLLQSFARLA